MRLSLRIFLISLFGMFCFFLGVVYDQLTTPNESPVTVTISNQSGQELKFLTLSHSGWGLKGVLDIEPPHIGISKTVRFFQPGEGGFTIEATLTNGQILKGLSGYIESGHSLSMVITATGISGGLDVCSNPALKRDCRKSAAAP